VKEDVGNKPLRVTAPVPEENTAVSKAGEVEIQLGAFRKRESAERLMRQLQGKGYDAYVEADTLKRLGLLHLVRVRGYASVSSAERAMAQLAQLGLRDAFVVD
jgi:cell division septation protein DedD